MLQISHCYQHQDSQSFSSKHTSILVGSYVYTILKHGFNNFTVERFHVLGCVCTITIMVVCWSICYSGCGPTVPCTHRVLPAESLIQLPPLSLAQLTKFYHKAYGPPMPRDVLHPRRHIPGPPGHLTFPLAAEFLIFGWWWKKRAGSAGMRISLVTLVVSFSELSPLLSQGECCSWGNSGAVKYVENTHF